MDEQEAQGLFDPIYEIFQGEFAKKHTLTKNPSTRIYKAILEQEEQILTYLFRKRIGFRLEPVADELRLRDAKEYLANLYLESKESRGRTTAKQAVERRLLYFESLLDHHLGKIHSGR